MSEKITLDENTEIRVQNILYNDVWKFDMRIFWRKDKKHDFVPTQKGISVRLNRFFEIHEAINRMYPKVGADYECVAGNYINTDEFVSKTNQFDFFRFIVAKIPYKYDDEGISEIWIMQNEDGKFHTYLCELEANGAYKNVLSYLPVEPKFIKKIKEAAYEIKRSVNRYLAKKWKEELELKNNDLSR